jgi:M6 family metalloprotease-like protein
MKRFSIFLVLLFICLPFSSVTNSNETRVCKVLPILIDFADFPHQRTASEMYNAFFSNKSFEQDPKNYISLRNFFKEVTNGLYDFTPGSYGVGDWLKMPRKKIEYKGKWDEANDLPKLMRDVFLILEKQNIDLSEYDQNKDGYFDYIIFICAGEPDSHTLFWWHAGWMGNAEYKGIKVGRYNMNGEKRRAEMNAPIQVICHEFYHYLGGWDLYSYDPDCKIDSIGPWDIMASASRKNFALSGFSRSQRGWIEEEIIDQSGTYEINALCTNNSKRLYRINIPDTKEYFLIENRYVIGTDSWWQGIPDQGLAIYHVDGAMPAGYRFNDGPPKYEHFAVWVENPGRELTFCLENNLTEFTPHTSPNSRDYKEKSLSEISIINISKSGLKMTFDVVIEHPVKPGKPNQPLLEVDKKRVDIGKIPQNKEIIETITIENMGSGVLEFFATSTSPLIKIENDNFKSNYTKFNFQIDTSQITNSIIGEFINIESNGGKAKILVIFEVVTRIGDFNNDGKTNFEDFKILQAAYGSIIGEKTYNASVDLNEDGQIDFVDFVFFSKNYDF